MRQEREGCALAVLVFPSGPELLTDRMIPSEEDGGFGERPRAMGVAERGPRGSSAFPRGFLGTRDATTVRGTILPPWEAVDLMDVIEPHEAEDRADTGARVPQRQGLGLMVRGGCDEGQFDVTSQRIVIGEKGAIDCNTLVHCRISTTLGDPVTVGFVGHLFANGGHMILTIGMLHMGAECAACAGQGHAAAQEVAGGAPRGGIPIGLREQATAQQHGDFVGGDLVVFRLAAMESFHREGMTQDARDPVVSTAIGTPVPGNHTCSGQDDRILGGRDSLAQRLWGGWHVPVQPRFPSLVEDTGTWCGRGDRYHSKTGVVSCKIALRSPPCS